MNVTLKSVPKKLHACLKEAAKRNGRSLNTEAIAALERQYLPTRLDPQVFLADLRNLRDRSLVSEYSREPWTTTICLTIRTGAAHARPSL